MRTLTRIPLTKHFNSFIHLQPSQDARHNSMALYVPPPNYELTRRASSPNFKPHQSLIRHLYLKSIPQYPLNHLNQFGIISKSRCWSS